MRIVGKLHISPPVNTPKKKTTRGTAKLESLAAQTVGWNRPPAYILYQHISTSPFAAVKKIVPLSFFVETLENLFHPQSIFGPSNLVHLGHSYYRCFPIGPSSTHRRLRLARESPFFTRNWSNWMSHLYHNYVKLWPLYQPPQFWAVPVYVPCRNKYGIH